MVNQWQQLNPSNRMKPNARTLTSLRMLLVINMVVFATGALQAQCPGGSTVNPGSTSTFNAGQTVCITGGVNTQITLNSGSTMVITNGGNYTGNISANSGAAIQVQAGGTFAPSQANNFAAAITNNGTVNFNNVGLSSGASITNNGSFNWGSNWNQNNAITVINTACGGMTFSQNTGLTNSAVINNNGYLNFTQGLTMNSGTLINNRGRVNVGGNTNINGTFRNQNIAVFRGGNNDITSNNVIDSFVNLGKATFTNSLTTSGRIRNDGLVVVSGSYTLNGGNHAINNSNAFLRVGGSLSNNGTVQGNGGLHIAGAVANNNTIAGYGAAAQRLTVNKASGSISGTTSNLIYNTALAAADTTTYTAAMANPASCAVLPVRLSTLQAVYHNNQVQLNWFAYEQSNARSFTIEYSLDGRTFTNAGELTAATNNTTTTPYQFTHASMATGTLHYRIRENDVDGMTYYSNTVVVKTGTLLLTTAVFPNPFKDILQISMQLEKAGVIQVALYNASGQVVRTLQQQGLTGRNTIPLGNLSALPTGTYLLQLKAGEHTSFEKIIK